MPAAHPLGGGGLENGFYKVGISPWYLASGHAGWALIVSYISHVRRKTIGLYPLLHHLIAVDGRNHKICRAVKDNGRYYTGVRAHYRVCCTSLFLRRWP